MSTEVQGVNFDKEIEILPLEKWLDYASGCDESVFVALPLIQRGSVWKPKQIIDLWDSLLRGMPMGSLMYSPMAPGIDVLKIGSKALTKTQPGAIGLIDGQQRTLAMLIAWSQAGAQMDRRIWIDFADKSGDEHLFRLHVTTKNQPFGFQKAAPSTKLSSGDRRDARAEFLEMYKVEKPSQETLFAKAKPYHSEFPIDLSELIAFWKNHEEDENSLISEIQKRLSTAEFDWTSAESKIRGFARALNRLFKLQIPLLKVDPAFFSVGNVLNADHDDEISDPPLAILFKRIGTGGTPLSDADYVYSVIKHRLPDAYTQVTRLHAAQNIAGLLSATDLVMSAVRLAAAEYDTSDKNTMTDWESPTKKEFHRLIKHGDFLEQGFFPLIKSGTLDAAFASLTDLLGFNIDSNPMGLPSHAFPLLNRPLVQVLLRWIRGVQLKVPSDLNAVLIQSREEVLRFVMYWQLCVIDPRKASLIAFEQLKEASISFPGNEIYGALLKNQVAIDIVSPKTITDIKSDVAFSSNPTRLRGWKRFDTQHVNEHQKRVVSLYQRWWGNGSRHVHPLLLWLQRETVSEFEGSPVAGRDDDTPYDYDHICPADHWGNWTGRTGKDRLIDFLVTNGDGGGHRYVGNSIGNIRVWDSSKNRSDGKDSPSKKLELDDQVTQIDLLKKSAIDSSQINGWRDCSGEHSWNETRAQAFQQVVEQRAFALYERFYTELGFSAWPEKQLDARE